MSEPNNHAEWEQVANYGKDAFEEGFDIADVPYDRGSWQRAAWLGGFSLAEQRAKRPIEPEPERDTRTIDMFASQAS